MPMLNTQYVVNNTTATYRDYQTWNYWNGTSTVTYGNPVWEYWNGGGGTGSTTIATYSNAVVWDDWNMKYETAADQRERYLAQAAEYAVIQADRQKEFVERDTRQRAAKAKAEDTFLEHLSEDQLDEYNLHQSVTVIGSDERRYLIHTDRGLAGNVEVFEEDQPILRLCAHPRDYVAGEQDPLPKHDHFFAQMLQIQHDAEEFCRVAIVHWRAA
jgi:hypothetical protein